MKTFYRISSKEMGTVLLKRRKIAKALRWWLRENGFVYKYMFLSIRSDWISLGLLIIVFRMLKSGICERGGSGVNPSLFFY